MLLLFVNILLSFFIVSNIIINVDSFDIYFNFDAPLLKNLQICYNNVEINTDLYYKNNNVLKFNKKIKNKYIERNFNITYNFNTTKLNKIMIEFRCGLNSNIMGTEFISLNLGYKDNLNFFTLSKLSIGNTNTQGYYSGGPFKPALIPSDLKFWRIYFDIITRDYIMING